MTLKFPGFRNQSNRWGSRFLCCRAVTQPFACDAQLFACDVLALYVNAWLGLLSHQRHHATHGAPGSRKLYPEIPSPTPVRPAQDSFLPVPADNTYPERPL